MNLPFSEACERNKRPILESLYRVLPQPGTILEIGSCTGQHVVFFASELPSLQWQPSDQAEYLDGLRSRVQVEGSENILPPIELDVLGSWPRAEYASAYSANTAHIMGWKEVCAMFEGVAKTILPKGVFCLYGPFNRNGEFTSESNASFDRSLKARDPRMGLRDVADLVSLADRHHMSLEEEFSLPANNQMLVFRKNDVTVSASTQSG